MKLTYKNLDQVRLAKNGNFRKNTVYFVYKDACVFCGEPYLDHKKKPSIYCSLSCASKGDENKRTRLLKYPQDIRGSKNPMYGVKLIGTLNSNYKGGYCSKNLASFDSYDKKLNFAEQTRRHPEDFGLLQVKCTYCNNWFTPPLHAVIDRVCGLKGTKPHEGRFYCSDGCRQACPIYNTQIYPKGFKTNTSREVQSELRQMVLERDNWTCQKCDKTIKEVELHCHHIIGVEQNPIESADIDNCITLCIDCHKEVHTLSGCNYYELRCNNVSLKKVKG